MKKFVYLVLALVVGSLMSASVSAVSLPDNESPFSFEPVNFKGGIPFVYDLTPGSKMTNAMRVHNFSDEEISLKLITRLPEGETGDLSWFSLSKSDVTIAPQSYEDVTFDIVIGADVPLETNYKIIVSARMSPDEESVQDNGDGESSGAQIGVVTAYAHTFRVHVGTGEPVVIDETPEEPSQVWPFIKENINTILLVLIFLLVGKMVCCRGKKK